MVSHSQKHDHELSIEYETSTKNKIPQKLISTILGNTRKRGITGEAQETA